MVWAKKRGTKKSNKRKATGRKPVSTFAIKNLIKKQINLNLEKKKAIYQSPTGTPTKMYQYSTNNVTNFNAANVFPITPYTTWLDITQGTGQGNRIGNKIRTMRAFLKIMMYSTQYDVTVNPTPSPQDVNIYICSLKASNLKVDFTTALGTNFFQQGNTYTGLTGTISDCIEPLNKDEFIFYKMMTKKLGFANYGGSGTDGNNQSYSNNDYKYNQMIKIDVTKYIPKRIQYNDTDASPTTRSVWVVINPVDANGTAPYTTAGQYPCNFYYDMEYTYTDA